jgi:hypothetical protein
LSILLNPSSPRPPSPHRPTAQSLISTLYIHTPL